MSKTPEEFTNGGLNKDLCQQIALHAYDKALNTPQSLKSGSRFLQLMESTMTLKLYRLNPTSLHQGYFIVGIRGTDPSSSPDLKADAAIAFNNLDKSMRWRIDEQTLRKWENGKYGNWSYKHFIWIGVGHSLGGAICDEALRRNLISYAVSYNAAVQPKDKHSPHHYKIYSEADPLYKIGKNVINQDPPEDVRKPLNHGLSTLVGKLPSFVGDVGKSYDMMKEHSITRFKGGKKRKGYNVSDLTNRSKKNKETKKDVVWKSGKEIEEDDGVKLVDEKKNKGGKKDPPKDPINRLRTELRTKC